MSKELFLIVGPTGSGKNYLANGLGDTLNAKMMVSTTTRQIRTGEADGVDYYFINREDYEQAIVNYEFVESITFDGEEYGISVNEFEGSIKKYDVTSLIVEPNGIEQVLWYILKNANTFKKLDLKINIMFLNVPRVVRVKNLLDVNKLDLTCAIDIDKLEVALNRIMRNHDSIDKDFEIWYEEGLKEATEGKTVIYNLEKLNDIKINIYEFKSRAEISQVIDNYELLKSKEELINNIVEVHSIFGGDQFNNGKKSFKDTVKELIFKEDIDISSGIEWLKKRLYNKEEGKGN